jgi:hypothetical protein
MVKKASLVAPMTIRSKLAVILHADGVGSTGLVRSDEQIAHERIQDAFRKFSINARRVPPFSIAIRPS